MHSADNAVVSVRPSWLGIVSKRLELKLV